MSFFFWGVGGEEGVLCAHIVAVEKTAFKQKYASSRHISLIWILISLWKSTAAEQTNKSKLGMKPKIWDILA